MKTTSYRDKCCVICGRQFSPVCGRQATCSAECAKENDTRHDRMRHLRDKNNVFANNKRLTEDAINAKKIGVSYGKYIAIYKKRRDVVC